MTETLLYFVYGNAPEYQLELGYSVLSAVRLMSDRRPRIVLMTDEAGRRPDLPVEHHIFSAEEFERWTESGRYNHGAKVHAYLAALRHYGGKVAMIDTDTYFHADPMQLFDRVSATASLMHDDEATLAQQGRQWDDVVAAGAQGPIGGYPITRASRMFNSGVVACHEAMLEPLQAVPDLIKAIMAVGSPFNAEQFAFAQILLRAGDLHGCKDLLRHYWGFERHFLHCQIAALMPERTAAAFDAALRDPGAVVTGSPKFSLPIRIAGKVKGAQRRAGDLYAFAYMAYLGAFAETRPDYANAWASTVLEIIHVGGFPRELIARDFKRLAKDRLNEASWIADRTRDKWRTYWARPLPA